MRPNRIVKGFQIREYIGLCTGLCCIALEVNEFTLEAAEEIFCYSIIVKIVLTRHTLPESIGFQPLSKGFCSILDATVTAKEQTVWWFTAVYCHVGRCHSQRSINTVGKCVAHYFVGTQVLYNGQIKPTLAGGNVGNIAYPSLILELKKKFRLRRLGAIGWLC